MDNTTIYLHHITCILADFPQNRTLCLTPNSSTDSTICYHCLWIPSYLFDGDGDFQSNSGCLLGENCAGTILTRIIAYLTIITGIIGAVTNILIIFVLKNGVAICGPSLTALLIPLTICDFLTSLLSALLPLPVILMMDNVIRSELTLWTAYMSLTLGYIFRTMSMLIAVVITVERYFVVAKPLKFKGWFTLRRSRCLCVGACAFAIVINIPRWFDAEWEEVREDGLENQLPSYQHYPYVLKLTDVGHIFYDKFCEIYFIIDFLVPLPTLLVLNYLIYGAIQSSNKDRTKLQCAQAQKEVHVATMFIWVFTILLLCHLIPILFHIMIGVFQMMYRDLAMASWLTISINSAVNFVIYCAFGEQFRTHFCRLILSFPGISLIYKLGNRKGDSNAEDNNNGNVRKNPHISRASRSISNSSNFSDKTRTSQLSWDEEAMKENQPVVV